MTAHDLLIEITRYDARLVRTADGLKVQAPAPLPADLMNRLRQHKPELLRLVDAEQIRDRLSRGAYFDGLLPAEAEKAGQVLHTAYGKGYVHADGRIADGQPEPMPPPIVVWPDALADMLRRVSTAFEWSTADRLDFVRWARRSPQGMTDAAEFLRHETDKLDIRVRDTREGDAMT